MVERTGKFVRLSAASQIIMERLGIQLTQGQVLEAGAEANMVFESNKQTFLYIDAFVDYLVGNLKAPTKKEDSRKKAATRYRCINVIVMRAVHELLFPEPASTVKNLRATIVKQMEDNMQMIETSTDISTLDELEKHLQLYVKADIGKNRVTTDLAKKSTSANTKPAESTNPSENTATDRAASSNLQGSQEGGQ